MSDDQPDTLKKHLAHCAVQSGHLSYDEAEKLYGVSLYEPQKPEGNYEQVGFYFKYMIQDQNTGRVKDTYVPQYGLMADYCFDRRDLCFDDSGYLKYNGKFWEPMSKNYLMNLIWSKNEEAIKPSHVDQFFKAIKSKCYKGAFDFVSTDGKLNLLNGVLDIKTKELEPRNSKYLFRYCAPTIYMAGSTCPRWLEFLHFIFKGDEALIDVVRRMFGYIIMGGDPFLHKAFVLYGGGRNGKSTLLDVLKALIGRDSYSTVSLSKIHKEFSVVSMMGKLANIVEETPTDEINAEIFKALVGGGEIQAAYKGHDEFTFINQSRFVFACNDMPVFKDRSTGLLDRLMFLPFDVYIPEGERDTNIKQKLLQEMPGILNWALKGAEIMYKERFIPTPDASARLKETYRKETDPLHYWFTQYISIDAEAKPITKNQLYIYYKSDAEINGNRPYSKRKFLSLMAQKLTEELPKFNLKYDNDFMCRLDKNDNDLGTLEFCQRTKYRAFAYLKYNSSGALEDLGTEL